jgi:hypothetical protein
MSQEWIHGLKPPPSIAECDDDSPDCINDDSPSIGFEGVEPAGGSTEPAAPPAREWKDGVSFIVNGGTTLPLQDATVPIEWRFSPEFKLARPQYIVICDHEMPFSRLQEERYWHWGRRYLVKVTDFAKYLQLFRAGTHHLVFMVFCGDENAALHQARRYESNYGDHCYDNAVYFNDVEQGWSSGQYGFYLAHVELNVPEKAFAEKPESGFWKHLRCWANLWFRNEPEDECAQRKRYPLAVIALPLFLLWRLITGVLGTLYTAIVWPCAAFLGWRPKSIWDNLKNSWINPRETDLEPSELRWGVLRQGVFSGNPEMYRKELKVPFWGMPWFVVLSISAAYGVFKLYKAAPAYVLAAVISTVLVLGGGFVFLLTAEFFKEAQKKRIAARVAKALDGHLSKKELRRLAQEEREMKEYLAQLDTMSLGTAPAPKSVDVNAVIKKAKPRIKLELSYWALKSKVCKPFQR